MLLCLTGMLFFFGWIFRILCPVKFQKFTEKVENCVILLTSKEKNVTEVELHYFSGTGKYSNNALFFYCFLTFLSVPIYIFSASNSDCKY